LKFKESLVAKKTERAQHRVGVYLQYRGKVSCWGQSFSGLRLTVSDRSSNLGGDLVVQCHRL